MAIGYNSTIEELEVKMQATKRGTKIERGTYEDGDSEIEMLFTDVSKCRHFPTISFKISFSECMQEAPHMLSTMCKLVRNKGRVVACAHIAAEDW